MGLIVPSVSLIAWMAIVLMVALNPSGQPLPLSPGLPFVMFSLFSSAAAFHLPRLALKRSPRPVFFRHFFTGLVALECASLFGGLFFHRDFHTFGAQTLLLYSIIFLVRLDGLHLVREKATVYGKLYMGALVAFCLWMFWLILMSYAIVTRTEPRWKESTIYNLVNGVIGMLLLYSAGMLKDQSAKRIFLRRGSLHLDDRDISGILSPVEHLVLIAFLGAAERTLACADLLGVLEVSDASARSRQPRCESCMMEQWKASSCPDYRNIKNRIILLKKYLELLQIGTIVPVSENPREIKETGWRLRLFDDVRWSASDPKSP